MEQGKLDPAMLARVNEPYLSHGHLLRALSFSRDGKRLFSASADGTVSAWDAYTGKELARYREGHIDSFALGPSRWAVAVHESHVGESTIRVRDDSDGEQVFAVQHQAGVVSSLAFSQDGKLIVSANRNTVRVWDAITALPLHVFGGDGGRVVAVAVSADSRLLACVAEDLRLWDILTGREIMRTAANQWPYLAVALHPNGNLAAAGGEELELWDLKQKRCVFHKCERTDAVCFTADGKCLVSGGPAGLRIWKLEGPRLLDELDQRAERITISPGNERCAFACVNDIVIFNLRTRQVTRRAYRIDTAVFADSHTLVGSCNDRRIRMWDLNAREINSLPGIEGRQIGCRSKSGALALSNDDDALTTVFDSSLERPLFSVAGGESAFSPAHFGLAAIRDNRLLFYSLPAGGLLDSFTAGEKPLVGLAFSADGRFLATGSYDRVVRVWETERRKLLRTLSGHDGATLALAFSSEGDWLASSAEDNSIRLWPISTDARARRVIEVKTWATSLLFAPRNDILIAGTQDGCLEIWDPQTGRLDNRVEAHQWRVHQLCMSTDERLVLSVSLDGSAIIWSLSGLLAESG